MEGSRFSSLTFASAVLCMRSEVQANMEEKLRVVGRLAPGAH